MLAPVLMLADWATVGVYGPVEFTAKLSQEVEFMQELVFGCATCTGENELRFTRRLTETVYFPGDD